MKNIIIILIGLLFISCNSSSDDEPQQVNDKYYLYKKIDIIDGKEKIYNYDASQCQSKSNIIFDNNNVTWQSYNYLSDNCKLNVINYLFDPIKSKIQVLPHLYYKVQFDTNGVILQEHFEENDDPNFTTVYYFKKK